MLCNSAIRNLEKYGTRLDPSTQQLVQRGVLINYDALPGYVPQILLPHFGIDPVPPAWLQKIEDESNFYSKSRGVKSRTFQSDSADKDSRSTAAIKEYAEKILMPTYKTLEEKAVQSLKSAAPALVDGVLKKNAVALEDFDWKLLSPIPSASELHGAVKNVAAISSASQGSAAEDGEGKADLLPTALRGVGHSTVLAEKEFIPWAPFANHHSSRSFQVSSPSCCLSVCLLQLVVSFPE